MAELLEKQGSRIAYLDNLKALMIIFVVIVHTAITYSGVGVWFYTERDKLDYGFFYFFLFLQTFSQAYFMSLLFAISGYFTPASLSKKGTKKFIMDRIFRLGLPALIFATILFPICKRMVDPNFGWQSYVQGIISFDFVSWTGPLWYTLTLLIFTFIYLAVKKWWDKFVFLFSYKVTVKNVVVLMALISLVAFTLRLFFPIGTSVLNLQLGFFSAYFFMFFTGVLSKEKNGFEAIDYRKAKKWFLAAFALGIPLWVILIISAYGQNLEADVSGLHLQALLFTIWESFFCVSMIIGLLGIFKARFNTQNRLQKFLSDNSFAVYVFHAPILIVISLFLKNVLLAPIIKFLLVVIVALPICFLFTASIRKIPLIKRIFS